MYVGFNAFHGLMCSSVHVEKLMEKAQGTVHSTFVVVMVIAKESFILILNNQIT